MRYDRVVDRLQVYVNARGLEIHRPPVVPEPVLAHEVGHQPGLWHTSEDDVTPEPTG